MITYKNEKNPLNSFWVALFGMAVGPRYELNSILLFFKMQFIPISEGKKWP